MNQFVVSLVTTALSLGGVQSASAVIALSDGVAYTQDFNTMRQSEARFGEKQ